MDANALIEAYVDDVVRHIDRKRRNDVGWELRALLREELAGDAADAGRAADRALAVALLRRFGRPEEVAARYREPGFPIVDAIEARSFVRLTAIGMALIWCTGLISLFSGGSGLERLGAWWMTWGLGAFWWPGFLVVMMSVAAWVRHRFPVLDDWMPRVVDRDLVNRRAWVLAIMCFTIGTIWLTAPAWFVEWLTGGRLAPAFYASLIYDDSFVAWRLPVLLSLLMGQVALYVALVIRGRWSARTRVIDMAFSVAITTMLLWSVSAGRIFREEFGDRIARGAIVLVALFTLWDLALKLRREYMRVRPPAIPV